MTARCIDQPVSWLRLELYQLSEVDDAERASIATHLASCPACAACLASVERDEASTLPPLPAAREVRARGLRSHARLGALGAGALALAAAVMLGVGGGWRHGSTIDSRGGGCRRVLACVRRRRADRRGDRRVQGGRSLQGGRHVPSVDGGDVRSRRVRLGRGIVPAGSSAIGRPSSNLSIASFLADASTPLRAW